MSYPDDLDDTFCALSALALTDPAAITGDLLAKAVSLLTAVEKKVGGPYRTWLVDGQAAPIWRDVDLVVNCNVGYFLSLHRAELPALKRLAQKAIKDSAYHSPYYPSRYPVIYFLSRYYTGRLSAKLTTDILAGQRADGGWGTPLQTALSMTSLLRLRAAVLPELKRAAGYLVRTVKGDHWLAEGFCLDPAQDKRRYYAGSPVLTTAFCLEALSLFDQTFKVKAASVSAKKEAAFLKVFMAELEAIQAGLPRNFRSNFNKLATRIITADRQIILLPFWFSTGSVGRLIPTAPLVRLASASLYGWMAYTIYDDFFDGEGQSHRLSLANLCLRRTTEVFSTDRLGSRFREISRRIMDNLDVANDWEVKHMRTNPALPLSQWRGLRINYPIGSLAQKSLGHALASLAVSSLKRNLSVTDLAALENFFRHYLIARQLNDDAHDWEEDLLAGQITYVLCRLWKDARAELPPHVTATAALPRLREVFWTKTVVSITKTAADHLNQATASLKKNRDLAEKITGPVRSSVQKTVVEQRRMSSFLRQYT